MSEVGRWVGRCAFLKMEWREGGIGSEKREEGRMRMQMLRRDDARR